MGTSKDVKSKNKDTGSSKTTSFSAAAKFLLIPTTATFILSAIGFSYTIAALPYVVIKSRMLNADKGESTAQFWTKFLIMEVFYCAMLSAFAFVVLLPMFGIQFTGFHTLAFYLPMFTITLHDRRHQYGPFGTFVVQTFFDVPLVVAGYICRELFGLRLLAPWADILDDTIVQGSLPFPSDIAVLAAEPYNVGLIINMCREYGGAKDEMKRCGIVQCYLPHQDTTAPSYESLVKGCAHIKQFKKHNPEKRVYVHCKGGIARASTMSLAHYVCNEDQDPSVAIRAMKTKRPVVFAGVKDFPAIIKLNDERLSKEQQEPKKAK